MFEQQKNKQHAIEQPFNYLLCQARPHSWQLFLSIQL